MDADHIFIEQLTVEASVGILPWERQVRQPLKLDLQLYLPLAQCARTERLDLSVDYVKVVEEIETLVHARHYDLIETLAEQLCAHLLARFPVLEAVRLRLDKPAAIRQATATGVTLYRTRQPA